MASRDGERGDELLRLSLSCCVDEWSMAGLQLVCKGGCDGGCAIST